MQTALVLLRICLIIMLLSLIALIVWCIYHLVSTTPVEVKNTLYKVTLTVLLLNMVIITSHIIIVMCEVIFYTRDKEYETYNFVPALYHVAIYTFGASLKAQYMTLGWVLLQRLILVFQNSPLRVSKLTHRIFLALYAFGLLFVVLITVLPFIFAIEEVYIASLTTLLGLLAITSIVVLAGLFVLKLHVLIKHMETVDSDMVTLMSKTTILTIMCLASLLSLVIAGVLPTGWLVITLLVSADALTNSLSICLAFEAFEKQFTRMCGRQHRAFTAKLRQMHQRRIMLAKLAQLTSASTRTDVINPSTCEIEAQVSSPGETPEAGVPHIDIRTAEPDARTGS